MALHERAGIAGIALPMQHPGRTRVSLAILFHLLEARQADDRLIGPDTRPFIGGVEILGAKLGPARRHLALEEGDAADIVEVRHRDAGHRRLSPVFRYPVRDLHYRAIG